MKIHLFTLTVSCLCMINAKAQLYLQSGATVTTTSGVVVTLKDINLQNNGTINQAAGAGKFLFNGTANSTVSGSGPTQFDNLEIAKTGTGKLSLGENITIGTGITFTSGNIDVGNYNVQLQPTAMLTGESETSRLMSTGTSGTATITTTLNAPNAANPGNLGAVITSTNNLGVTTISRGFASQTNGIMNSSSILRYYDIAPTNNTSLNATLRINYLDAELNGLDESKLIILKSDNNTVFTPLGFTTRDAVADYVQLTGIPNFSRWTVSATNNALPITLVSFNATCENDHTILQWLSSNEVNAASFVIQKSLDAVAWMDLQTIAATNNINGSSYTYKDISPSGKAYYRLKMVDKDGSFAYSSIFSGGCAASSTVFGIYPNPAHNNATAMLSVNENCNAMINLYGTDGKLFAQHAWALQKGINSMALPEISRLPAGSYIVKIVLNGGSVQSKLIKQ